ncbi:hypothetical protein [Streptomyces sp. NPDC005423]|uniref:hypothetical protein n=1 Tax=Streptomyces sp. NPDC005423 TaxID=3155343 RepID=UPI0033A2AA2A
MADDLSEIALWDPDEVTIFVRLGTHLYDVVREIHEILTIDLGAPSTGAGLSCFCGAGVELPAEVASRSAQAGAPTS